MPRFYNSNSILDPAAPSLSDEEFERRLAQKVKEAEIDDRIKMESDDRWTERQIAERKKNNSFAFLPTGESCQERRGEFYTCNIV